MYVVDYSRASTYGSLARSRYLRHGLLLVIEERSRLRFAQDFDTLYSNSQQQEVLLKDDELTRTTVVLLLVLEERSLHRTSIQYTVTVSSRSS